MLTRLLWLTHPENCPDPQLKKFLISQPFEKWAYLPVDATGPHDKITGILKHTIEGFDRARGLFTVGTRHPETDFASGDGC